MYFIALSGTREMVQYSSSPMQDARERVPDRTGLTQTQALEHVEIKSPHPAFGHLLPPAAGEGQLGKWGSIR